MSVINRVKLREASIGFLKKSRSLKPTPNTVAIAGRSHIPSVKKGLGEKPSLRFRNSIVERGKLMEVVSSATKAARFDIIKRKAPRMVKPKKLRTNVTGKTVATLTDPHITTSMQAPTTPENYKKVHNHPDVPEQFKSRVANAEDPDVKLQRQKQAYRSNIRKYKKTDILQARMERNQLNKAQGNNEPFVTTSGFINPIKPGKVKPGKIVKKRMEGQQRMLHRTLKKYGAPMVAEESSIVARGKLLENTAMDRFIAKNYVPGVGPNKKAKKVVDNLKLKSNPLFDYFDVLQGRLRGKMMNPKLESSIVERANLREAGITDIAAQRERLHKLKLRLLKSSVKKSYPVSDPKDYRPNATTGRYTHKVSSDFPHATVTDHKLGTTSYADPDMVKEQHRREVFPEWYKESHSIVSRGILRESWSWEPFKKLARNVTGAFEAAKDWHAGKKWSLEGSKAAKSSAYDLSGVAHGVKPAAIVEDRKVPAVKRKLAAMKTKFSYADPKFDHGQGHIIGQHKNVKILHDAFVNKEKFTPIFHSRVGTALGYPEKDVTEYTAKHIHNKNVMMHNKNVMMKRKAIKVHESSIISRGILREAALFGGMKKTNLPISDKVKSPDLRMKRKAKKAELPVAKSGEVYDPSWLYGMKNPYNN